MLLKIIIYWCVILKGIYELNINDFRHGGATLFGFSFVDYHNVNSVKMVSDMLQSRDPINKLPIIPVKNKKILEKKLIYLS